MTTSRDTETLTQLVADAAGQRGSGLTYEQLSERSVDWVTHYQPSRALLGKIGKGQDVKISPKLVRAISEGLGLPLDRVEAAAHRQYIAGFESVDPGIETEGGDEVIRTATRGGVTPRKTAGVEEHVRRSRADEAREQG